MELQKFLECIRNKEIPTFPPSPIRHSFEFGFLHYKARDECISLGMFSIVDKTWTKVLANWIGTRSVLEIMAGGGWIAKALSEHGIEIIATDNFKWGDKQPTVYRVEKLDAVEAVKCIKADILLVSWPPYESHDIVDACDVWGIKRPIVYIGEGDGGCNAPREFFENFEEIEGPTIPMAQWDGIHDCVTIGYWTTEVSDGKGR